MTADSESQANLARYTQNFERELTEIFVQRCNDETFDPQK